MLRLATASVLSLLALLLVGCPKPQGYDFRLTPEELRVIQGLQPGQTATKTFTFTLDPSHVENCCSEGDCCCTCQCDPKPCICTCTDEIIVSGSGARVSEVVPKPGSDQLASGRGTAVCRAKEEG